MALWLRWYRVRHCCLWEFFLNMRLSFFPIYCILFFRNTNCPGFPFSRLPSSTSFISLIFLWEGFSIWDSLSPFPFNGSGVDFNSITGFLVYMRYFFSFVFFTLFYAFPVDLFCSRGLHRLFHRELFSAIALWMPIPRSFLHDAGVFLSGMCACPLRFQSFLSLVQQSLLGPRLDFPLFIFE